MSATVNYKAIELRFQRAMERAIAAGWHAKRTGDWAMTTMDGCCCARGAFNVTELTEPSIGGLRSIARGFEGNAVSISDDLAMYAIGQRLFDRYVSDADKKS